MSTQPAGWQNPKTNWTSKDGVGNSALNRIEGNINAIETGNRTLNQDLASPSNTGNLRQILSWFAGQFKRVIGDDWWKAPAASIASIWAKFSAATGHTHSGNAEDGPQLPISSLENAAKTSAGGTEAGRLAVTDNEGAVGLARDAKRLGGQDAANFATLEAAQAIANARWREEAGFGVATGLAVSPGSGMTLSVAAGRCYLNDGSRKAVSGTTSVTLSAASSANPRKDVIYVDSTGNIQVSQGTPASSPAEPSIPSTAIKLAVVTVPKSASSIIASNIQDARQFVVGPANGRLVLPVGTDLWAN